MGQTFVICVKMSRRQNLILGRNLNSYSQGSERNSDGGPKQLELQCVEDPILGCGWPEVDFDGWFPSSLVVGGREYLL